MNREQCPHKGKVCYRSPADARRAVRDNHLLALARIQHEGAKLYPYQCPFCPWWHLTKRGQ